MDASTADRVSWLRLLECWLPLAQELNVRQGWGYDTQGIERLILAAAPQLSQAGSLAHACQIFWVQHLRQRSIPP